MTIKDLAYSAHQHLQNSTGNTIKRAHVYELFAAAFGFKSYAAFCVDAVLAESDFYNSEENIQGSFLAQRFLELGYQSDLAKVVAMELQSFLMMRQISCLTIPALISELRSRVLSDYDYYDDEIDIPYDEADPVLVSCLEHLANKGSAQAHYALALVYATGSEDHMKSGSDYWYSQAQQGCVLTGAQKAFADSYANYFSYTEKHKYHLREAGRLGSQEALLVLAKRFGDSAFFEQGHHKTVAHPAKVAAIAEDLGRFADAEFLLVAAAEEGNVDAMLDLINSYHSNDLIKCWKWVYLSKLVNRYLTRSNYRAVHEDGSDYDDVGGPLEVVGYDGVSLKSIDESQHTAARLAAQNLYQQNNLELRYG